MRTGRPDPVTEAELHAWLDGELPSDRRSAVETHLAEHPEDAARLDSYRAHKTMIGRVFSAPVPPLAKGHLRPSRGRRMPVWGALAAGVALFLAGSGAGWLARGTLDPGRAEAEAAGTERFVADAVAAHRIYAVEVRHPVEVGSDEQEHLVAWLSKRLAAPLSAPDLRELGFSLVGGRLLPGPEGPAGQLMYENAEGRRITLYMRSGAAADTSFRLVEKGGVAALFWRDAGLTWALSGELEREALVKLARTVYEELNS